MGPSPIRSFFHSTTLLLLILASGNWIAWASPVYAHRFPALPIEGTFNGFHFTPGRPCEQMLFPTDLCRSMHPKSWTRSEMLRMEALLAPLFEGTSTLTHFFSRIQANGFNSILRYASGSGSAWVSRKDNSINIADSLLNRVYPPDTTSGFNLQSQIVLHELAHAFDHQGLAYSTEFLRLAGWTEGPGRQYYIAGVQPSEIDAAVGRFVALIREGKMTEAYTVNRNFGLAHGFPTAYSMTTPSECFAEMVSHAFFDPLAGRYMSPELLSWLRANVLH